MIDGTSLQDFQAHLKEVFTLRFEDGSELELELVDAGAFPERPAQTRRIGGHEVAVRPNPFWLMFRGPAEPQLAQRLYPLHHPQMGLVDGLFLVPCDHDHSGSYYHVTIS